MPTRMVHAMALDCGSKPRVACCVLLIACAPSFKPPEPPPEPTPTAKLVKVVPAQIGRHVVVGEMCPQGAGGRAAVDPLVMRGVQWTDTTADVDDAVERGTVPRFGVYGVDGKMAGAFDTLGLVDLAPGLSVATGTYVGASPCTYEIALQPTATQGSPRAEEPACGLATGGCGLAVGEIARPDDPPETPTYAIGGACIDGDNLAVDIDGTGKLEAFPLAGVLDGIRAPASEWTATPNATPTCTPKFQLYDVKLTAEADPKSTVTLDVLGVVDLDGDGRREVVLALRFPTVRTIVVYTATQSAQRLELAGEGNSFGR